MSCTNACKKGEEVIMKKAIKASGGTARKRSGDIERLLKLDQIVYGKWAENIYCNCGVTPSLP